MASAHIGCEDRNEKTGTGNSQTKDLSKFFNIRNFNGNNSNNDCNDLSNDDNNNSLNNDFNTSNKNMESHVLVSRETTPPPTLNAVTTTTTTCPTTSSTTTISPSKRNKRKMAEPKRRVTDFSIRNICSENTSCSSFASEIESDVLDEKRSKIEEFFQNMSGQVTPRSNCDLREVKDAAPLDVLVSLSLLTQHRHHLAPPALLLPQPPPSTTPADFTISSLSSSLHPPPGSMSSTNKKLSRRKPQKTRSSAHHFSLETEKDCLGIPKDQNNAQDSCGEVGNNLIFNNRASPLTSVVVDSSRLENVNASSASLGYTKTKLDDIVSGEIKSEKDPEFVNVDDNNTEESSSEMCNTNRQPSPVITRSNLSEQAKPFLHHPPPQQQSNNDHSSNSSCSNSSNGCNSNGNINPNNNCNNQRKNYKNMTKQRRIEANARERTRVHTISAAFESLRKAVPSYSSNQRLSKLAILRIACSYILALAKLAELDDYESEESTNCDKQSSSSSESLTFGQCVDLCTQTIHSEGKTKRRH